jgi:hypothetical protein
MQQEKIELPKFTVPGQTNWGRWALVGVGGLVAVSLIAFAVALSRRPTPDITATKAVDVPLAPSATPRPVKPTPTLAAANTAEAAPAAEEAPAAKVKSTSRRPRRAHTSHKTLARAASGGSSASSGKSGKSDPLDDILKRFK